MTSMRWGGERRGVRGGLVAAGAGEGVELGAVNRGQRQPAAQESPKMYLWSAMTAAGFGLASPDSH